MPKVSILINAKDQASPQLKKVSSSLKEGTEAGKKYDSSMDKARKSQDKLGASAGKVARSMKGLLPVFGVAGGLTAMFAIGKNALDAWKVQEEAVANMEAGLKSTGYQAGLTSKQLQNMASSIQETGIFGDEDIIQNLTTQLLTFGNIGSENFQRVQVAALDVTAKLKGVNASSSDVMSTAIMMGKAMDDPVRGLNAMRRVGISFSAEQKDMVRQMMAVNNVTGAQQVLLEAIEKQYGGTNEALAETTAGMERAAQNKLGDSMELLGKRLVPVKVGLMEITSNLADWMSMVLGDDEDKFVYQMENLIKKGQELDKLEREGTVWSGMKANRLKVQIGYQEQMLGIELDLKKTGKERVGYYQKMYATYKDINAQAEELNSTESTEIGPAGAKAKAEAKLKNENEKVITESMKAQWRARKVTANSYYNNLVEKSLDAKRTEEERIEATRQKELATIKKHTRYLSKEQVKRAKDIVDADARYSAENLRVQRLKEMYKEISKIEVEFFTASTLAEVEAVGQMSQTITDEMLGFAGDVSKVFEDIEKDATRTGMNLGDAFKIGASMATTALSSLSAILTMQNSLVQAGYNRQIEALREKHERESELLEESYEAMAENTESKDELRLAELAMYEEALEGKMDAEIRYAIQKKRLDLTRAEEENELEKKKAEEQKKIDQEYAMAEYKLEVEAFKAQQKYEKSMVKIQTAIGIVNAWSSAMRLPWPMNVSVGGTLTGLMLATAKKQTSLIESQEPPAPPKFADGVTNFEGGWAMVGERGPEMVTLPQGSNVITNENTEKLLGGSNAPIYVVNEIYLDSTMVARNMVEARRSASYGGY